ncbi:MAG: YidC/Oxa1 family insertase periplasmic-domain containing protein [Acidiferrobacterales bacterium]
MRTCYNDTMILRYRLLVIAVALACAVLSRATLAGETTINVVADQLRLTFSTVGADLVRWQACHSRCADGNAKTTVFNDLKDPAQARLVAENDTVLNARLAQLRYKSEQRQTDSHHILRFTSEPLLPDVRLEKVYKISKQGYSMSLSIHVRGQGAEQFLARNRLALHLNNGKAFMPPPAAGFAGAYERVRAVYFKDNDVLPLEIDEDDSATADIDANRWVGVRNRFWALLVRQNAPAQARLQKRKPGALALAITTPSGADALSYEFYGGPIEYDALQSHAMDLTKLLFSGLWVWMRAISLGLLFLLTALYSLVGNYGVAIALLAVAVKILMWPLTKIADRWQQQVNETQSRLQPQIKEIKASHKGAEQTERIVELYKQEHVHPLYALKSLFGFLIQIPIFIAAFYMLNENFGLSGVSLAWVDDLSKPDHLARLPFQIPFFGGYLNLLPFIMTTVTLLASWLYDAPTLSAELQRRQRLNLYIVAFVFFVLFYTFPAGMVFYWTCTNLIQFIKDQTFRQIRLRRSQAA